jgi:hypothetical protein
MHVPALKIGKYVLKEGSNLEFERWYGFPLSEQRQQGSPRALEVG